MLPFDLRRRRPRSVTIACRFPSSLSADRIVYGTVLYSTYGGFPTITSNPPSRMIPWNCTYQWNGLVAGHERPHVHAVLVGQRLVEHALQVVQLLPHVRLRLRQQAAGGRSSRSCISRNASSPRVASWMRCSRSRLNSERDPAAATSSFVAYPTSVLPAADVEVNVRQRLDPAGVVHLRDQLQEEPQLADFHRLFHDVHAVQVVDDDALVDEIGAVRVLRRRGPVLRRSRDTWGRRIRPCGRGRARRAAPGCSWPRTGTRRCPPSGRGRSASSGTRSRRRAGSAGRPAPPASPARTLRCPGCR